MAKRKCEDTAPAVTPAKSKTIQGILKGSRDSLGSQPGSPNRSVHFRPPGDLQEILEGIHKGKTDKNEISGLLTHLESLRGQTLVLWLKALQANISLLNLQMEYFVSELLKISWADQEMEVIEGFKGFLMNLVSAHAIYTKHVVRSLINKFRPVLDEDSVTVKPDVFNKKEKLTFTNTHTVIKGLLEVSPVGVKDELIRQIDILFPYIKSSAHKQACYISNIIYLRSYLLNGKREILQILMERLVRLDAHVPREEIELNLDDAEYGSDGVAILTDNQTMSLDIFMSFLFKLLYEETHNTDAADPVYDPVRAKAIFRDMILIYMSHVLSTFQISHAPFLYFYLAGLNTKLGVQFFETNWTLFTNPNSASLVRQTAISYIASFVSRALFVNISMAKGCLEKLVSWIHGYIRNSNVSTSLDFMYTDLKCHGPFYAACQAAFYIFAFRHQELVEEPSMLKFIQSLSFNSIVTCHLNPLRVCLPGVVRNFSAISRNYQLAYCQTVIERNNRLNLPVVGSLSSSGDQGKPLLLDGFFPYDPYLLPQSKPWIQDMYREYQGDSHSDSDDEQEDGKDDEEDEGSGEPKQRHYSTGSLSPVYTDYEEQWAGVLMAEEQHDTNNGSEAHAVEVSTTRHSIEQPPPGLMQSSRTDSINSTTVFVNPNDIQPQYNADHDIQSAEQMANHHTLLQRKTPQKRRHSEIEEQSAYENVITPQGTVEVLNLNVDVAPGDQIIYTTEDGNHINIVENGRLKQERNSIEPPSPGNQDSRHSWAQDTVVINPGQSPSPTGLDPSIVNWPGQFLFDVNFAQLSLNTKNKNWDYSKKLKKLFIDMNRFVQSEFRVGVNPPEGMFIRALPVYAVSSHVRNPVVRCPNHASQNDPTNQHFPYPQHLIRVQDESAIYENDADSGRLSVLFPVGAPHQGTDSCSRMLKFMCLGSDVGGINRKPVKVIFSLEAGPGRVVGRKVVDVRICSCPKRDMQQEEDKLERQEEQARSVARRLAENTHVIMGPPPKKKKLMKKGEEIIMVPVAADDFKKLNEFAEAAMIVRHPEKAEQIREMRRKLLQEHNEELIHSLEKRKKP